MGTQDKRLGVVWPLADTLEDQRLLLQEQLDSYKTIDERRRLGQYATPTALARDIVAFGLRNMDSPNDVRFIDPAFGTGAFYSALLLESNSESITEAVGVEIDPIMTDVASELWFDSGIEIITADFTVLEPDNRFNLIICNPPYVRHQLIDSESKIRIKDRTETLTGVKLSGLAGLYCHFLLQSIQWMDEGAIAGWLIPSEFMDVNYGKAIKDYLLSEVELFRIHRFKPEDVQFGDALVSSAVVWFRKKKPENRSIEFSFGGSLAAPLESKDISVDSLKEELKWSRFPCQSQRSTLQNAPKLRDFFDVKRGIATGGNDFFILEESRILELGLPFEFFRPVLPSARYVKTSEIKADKNGNPILPQKLFLLDCRLSEDEISENYPQLWDYLENGKSNVANGYLCKTRKCWYFQEQREAPIFVCTYMGRVNGERDSAFRFILNNSKATVTNSYLALYPRKNLAATFLANPSMKRTICELLNKLTPESLHDEGRIYGGGLRKIEPRELLNTDVPLFAGIV